MKSLHSCRAVCLFPVLACWPASASVALQGDKMGEFGFVSFHLGVV